MSWLLTLLVRVGELGPWGLVLFALMYIVAAVTMAPAFVLAVALREVEALQAGIEQIAHRLHLQRAAGRKV